jgi:hypothetical protein
MIKRAYMRLDIVRQKLIITRQWWLMPIILDSWERRSGESRFKVSPAKQFWRPTPPSPK